MIIKILLEVTNAQAVNAKKDSVSFIGLAPHFSIPTRRKQIRKSGLIENLRFNAFARVFDGNVIVRS